MPIRFPAGTHVRHIETRQVGIVVADRYGIDMIHIWVDFGDGVPIRIPPEHLASIDPMPKS